MATLSDHATRDTYRRACQTINNQLDKLSVDQVKQRLVNAANAALVASRVPAVSQGNDSASGSNAYFDFGPWKIVFGGPLSGKRPLTQAFFVRCANVVYHEARHCEQWYRMAQAVARGYDHISNQDLFLAFQQDIKRDAANINKRMGIHLSAATAAVSNPDYSPVPRSEIQKWWRSIYAVNRNRRGKVLQHLDDQDNYDRYRNLAEEVDAWRLGDTVGEEVKEAIGLRDDQPSYRDWKVLTAAGAKWYQGRSSDLKAIDKAFEKYDKSKLATDKEALKLAFQPWYAEKVKKGSTIRNMADDDGVGIVERLRAFLGA